MFKKTSEQLFKYLYIISFCEHIPKHWFLITLQAKAQSFYLSFKININGPVTWEADIYLSVKYDFRSSICTMYITSSQKDVGLELFQSFNELHKLKFILFYCNSSILYSL